jgi:hypothetical protein
MELPIKYINLTPPAQYISLSSNVEGVRPLRIIRLIPVPTAESIVTSLTGREIFIGLGVSEEGHGS